MSLQFAVFGNPIAHSRSPELHQAFAQQFNIDLQYRKVLVELDQFEREVSYFFETGGRGLNITVPFKERAFAMCQHLTERASIAKAVNTLFVKDGALWGDNTDGEGLVQALFAHGLVLNKAKILILGAGGATRGVIYPLSQAGVESICIANRTISRAVQLVDDLQGFVPQTALSSCGLSEIQGTYDLVINATSASLSDDNGVVLPPELIFSFAYEMAYGKPSQFLAYAQQHQIAYADGWSMLVGQAIEAFYVWHGVRPQLNDFINRGVI